MPKAGPMTAKAIGNKIKSKGLQKLRWFCQMCNKQWIQVVVESTFLLLIVAENPEAFVDAFSKEFEEAVLKLLKRTKGTKRTSASVLYNEFINDKEHLHMNSTKWETLTDFVKYLGREGLCFVDETPKGWFITYIDKDPEVLKRQELLAKMDKATKDESDRQTQVVANMRGDAPVAEATELQRTDATAQITFAVKTTGGAASAGGAGAAAGAGAGGGSSVFKQRLKAAGSSFSGGSSRGTAGGGGVKRKLSAMERIKEEEERRKQQKLDLDRAAAEAAAAAAAPPPVKRKDYWLFKDIIVKVMNKKIGGGKYYKQKGTVSEVVNRYGAKVQMFDAALGKVTIDQDELQTVIPAAGKDVLVLNGRYRGFEAVLVSVQQERFSCTLKLVQGPMAGETVSGVDLEDVSKL
eukprot:gene7240-13151_t